MKLDEASNGDLAVEISTRLSQLTNVERDLALERKRREDTERALSDECPDCAGCGQPLPSARSLDALRRLLGADDSPEDGTPWALWRAGYCDAGCRKTATEHKLERRPVLAVVDGGVTHG
jgi:hypothetical protein